MRSIIVTVGAAGAALLSACDNYDPVDCLAPYHEALDVAEYQGTGCIELIDRKACLDAGGTVSENEVDETGSFCEAQGYPFACGDVFVADEGDCPA